MLRIPLADVHAVRAMARNCDLETCAFGLVYPASAGESGADRFVVRGLKEVPSDAYLSRSPAGAALRPEYCVEMANAARAAGAGVLLAHTHPGPAPLEGFSAVDDAGEQLLATYYKRRVPHGSHFSAVFTGFGSYARRLGTHRVVPVVGVGPVVDQAASDCGDLGDQYDRQVRAFGTEGQLAIELLTVAIVGLGGTGSIVAEQLAHLGSRTFILVDPDRVELTNLNRLVGAVPADVGAFKVDVAARHIRATNPTAECVAIVGDILDDEIAARLAAADFVFGCTDSMASRAILNQFAYQRLIPCIDVGVGIGALEGKIQYLTGRTQMLSAGLPCMVCTDKLDPDQVRRELMSPEQRRRDPYIVGAHVPQPAVISLNATMSSTAVTMFLAAVAGVPSHARMLIYDGMRGSLRPAAMTPRLNCIVCSFEGALARGSTWQLPVRARDDGA